MRNVLGALAVLTLATMTQASPIITEGFDYTAGSALLGQTNPSTSNVWLRAGATATTTAINIDSNGSSLDVDGVGNHSAGTNRLGLPTPISSGTVYYSFQMTVTALTGSNNTTGGFFIGLNNTGNSSQATDPNVVGAKVQARIDPNDATKYDLGVFTNVTATAAAPSWDPNPFKVGDLITIVAAYTFNTNSTTDDVASIWINPSASDLASSTAPTPTETSTGMDISNNPAVQVGSIIIRQSPAPYLTMDTLSLGTSWSDVTADLVPEPASLSLLAIGALALAGRRDMRSHDIS